MTGSEDEPVQYELRDAVALIALNRSSKRNAISDEGLLAIESAVARATDEARAAVIHGIGDHFCAGLDLDEHARRGAVEAVHHSRLWHSVFGKIAHGRIPVISALHGAVIGGGLELAAATHIRVADDTAFFALPEGQRGIFVGGGGSVRIARLIGAARMVDMMLTGRVLRAAEMEQWGGVSYVVGKGAALDHALDLAAQAASNAELSNYAIINALPRAQETSMEDGLFMESIMSALTTTTPEAEDRLRAFLEGRADKVKPAG